MLKTNGVLDRSWQSLSGFRPLLSLQESGHVSWSKSLHVYKTNQEPFVSCEGGIRVIAVNLSMDMNSGLMEHERLVCANQLGFAGDSIEHTIAPRVRSLLRLQTDRTADISGDGDMDNLQITEIETPSRAA